MKIVDANTGQELSVGRPFSNINGRLMLLATDIGILRGRALVKHIAPAPGPSGPFLSPGVEIWTPLVVRYTHPAFFLQKVAFLRS